MDEKQRSASQGLTTSKHFWPIVGLVIAGLIIFGVWYQHSPSPLLPGPLGVFDNEQDLNGEEQIDLEDRTSAGGGSFYNADMGLFFLYPDDFFIDKRPTSAAGVKYVRMTLEIPVPVEFAFYSSERGKDLPCLGYDVVSTKNIAADGADVALDIATMPTGAYCLVAVLGPSHLNAGWFGTIYAKPDQDSLQSTTELMESILASMLFNPTREEMSAASRARYFAQFSYPSYKIGTVKTYDGPYTGFIGVDAQGKEHELVPVQMFSEPAMSNWAFYYSFIPGSDASAWPYFAFNKATGELKILRTVESYIEDWYPDKKKVSPSGLFMLSAYHWSQPDREGILFKLDLVNDSVLPIHSLAEGETFIKDFLGMGASANSDIVWLDANTIKYHVYQRVVDPETEGYDHPLTNPYLRTETFDLRTGAVTII